MYFITDDLTKIDPKKISLGKTYVNPTKEVTNIYIKPDSKEILKQVLISTPNLELPWNKTYTNDDTSFNIEFCNNNSNFIDDFYNVCDKIISKVAKKRNIVERAQDHFKNYPNNAKALRFFNVKICDISMYDQLGSKMSVDKIMKEDVVKCLIMIKSCWIKDSKVGIDLRLIQVMRISPYSSINQKQYLLSSSNSATNDKHHQKYSKMVQIGVPPQSIINAINMDTTLNNDNKTIIKNKLGLNNLTGNDNNISSTVVPAAPPLPNNLGSKKQQYISLSSPLSSISIDELKRAKAKLKITNI